MSVKNCVYKTDHAPCWAHSALFYAKRIPIMFEIGRAMQSASGDDSCSVCHCAICHYLHCCIRCAHVFSQRKFLHNLFEKGLNKHYHYLVPALYCLLLATKRNEVVNMMGTSHMCTIYVETRNNYGHKRRVKYCYFCTLCAMFLLCAANWNA